jgi:hypothetical protein
VAVTNLAPYSPPADLVSLKEASVLFAETGHEATPRTLKRWTLKHGVHTERIGKEDHASWTDLLEIHAEEVDRRQAGHG